MIFRLAIASGLLALACLPFGGCTTSPEPSREAISVSETDPALPPESGAAPETRPVAASPADPSTTAAAGSGTDPGADDDTSGPTAREAADAPPFRISETLYYDLRWEALKVGEGVMMVRGPEEVDGELCYHLTLQVRTDPVIDLVYKVRTRIEGWPTLAMERTMRYHKRQIEGKTNRSVKVDFDWQNDKAYYTNWGNPYEPVLRLKEDVYDPMSAVFYFRTLDLEPGTTYNVPITDGKKWIDGVIDALRYETVDVPLGSFRSLLVRPDVGDAGGVFKKSPDAEVLIWLSDDRYRIPVKMASSVVVGDFSAVLREIEIEGKRGIPPGMAFTAPEEEDEAKTGPRR